MTKHFTLICLLTSAIAFAGAAAAAQLAPVICKFGDRHQYPLVEVAPGTSGSHQATSIELGPSKRVSIQLPAGTELADSEPLPVRSLNSSTVQVRVKRGRNVETVNAPVVAQGGKAVSIIQARMETYSYQLPEDCRVLSAAEQRNRPLALLNNAGCLFPDDVHEALADIPGTRGVMARDCGWKADPPAAMRLLKRSADLGSRDAGWILSQFYLGNVDPSFQNKTEALDRLSRTADFGHASADLMQGIMRWRGDGLKADAEAAFSVLLPHARQGSREAQGIIGMMYLTGNGVPVNRVQAYAWCYLAMRGHALMYTDPMACRDAAEEDMS
ncbi:MAG: tetratricopeptide repeat protein, partial [Gammaproteobacteria bacterium]